MGDCVPGIAISLRELWVRFSLTKMEKEETMIEDTWVEGSIEKGKFCLFGRVLTRKIVNMEPC